MKRFHALSFSRYQPCRQPNFPFARSGLWQIFRIALRDSRFAFHSSCIATYAEVQIWRHSRTGVIFIDVPSNRPEWDIARLENSLTAICIKNILAVKIVLLFAFPAAPVNPNSLSTSTTFTSDVTPVSFLWHNVSRYQIYLNLRLPLIIVSRYSKPWV